MCDIHVACYLPPPLLDYTSTSFIVSCRSVILTTVTDTVEELRLTNANLEDTMFSKHDKLLKSVGEEFSWDLHWQYPGDALDRGVR
ncbi:hypothetical protein EG68_09556 [Paragonimus skrjabini miyazakii]|uniref:Uncharacterized protein n=1 Tax=Paragonimus skrjabini miyazakii TaxID=59628 RepID=A0A8S9YPZ1_9TREM|nr:hypothetical protein EG68_09556 [Paragonimus skrjabini miyazakii]